MIDAKYLVRVVPDPTTAHPGYVGVWIRSDTGIVWGRAFGDKQAALNFANAMVGRPVDVFFGMSLQSSTKPPKKNSRGRIVLPANKFHDDALLLKAWWLDIDLKGGYFTDTNHALQEVLGVWLPKSGLPKPSLIVMTGSGGFHLYWILDEPITRQVWEPLAWALRTAATMHFKPRPNPKGGRDLTLDFGLTTDAGRILRAPGSLNHKDPASPKPVFIAHEGQDYTLAVMDAALTPHKIAYAPRVSQPTAPRLALGKPSPVFAGVALPGPLDAGVDTSFYMPTIDDVAEECPWVDATLQTGGADQPEPLWREALRLCHFVQEGPKVAHDMSRGWVGHDGSAYDPDEVDKKFEDVNTEKYGWPQCSAIHAAGGVECAQCPHLSKGKSPLNFVLPKAAVAAVAAVAVATSPLATGSLPQPTPTVAAVTKVDWPPGYKQDADGIVYTMIEDPKDPDKPAVRANVMPYPILNMRAHRPGDAGGSWGISLVVQTTREDIIEARVSYKEYMDPRKLKDALGDQGIGLDPQKYIPLLGKLMASFVERLRSSVNRVEDTYSLGWYKSKADGKRNGFVFDGMLRNGVGNRPVDIVDRGLKDLYTPRGALDDWKKISGLLFGQRRPSLEAILAIGIGAPFIGMLGYKGGFFSSWSPETGLQKTMATKLTQSFWGDPSAGLGGLTDTQNFIVQRLAALGSLPFLLDDLKSAEDNRQFANLIMQGPQGRSKGRSHRSGLYSNPVLTWENIVLVNSNTSLVRSISDVITQTIAGAVRVMEQRVMPNRTGLGMISRTDADMALAKLDTNYGRPAVLYADFIGGKPDFCEDCLKRTREAIWNVVKGNDEDRFHVSMATVGLVGAKFANHLQLTDFDLDMLSGYFPELIQEQRGERSTSMSDLTNPKAIEALISNYLTFRGDCIFVSDNVRTTPGKAPAGWSIGRINSSSLRHIHVRVARTQKLMRISASDFQRFVEKDRKIGRSVIIDHVLRALPGVRVLEKCDLGQGYEPYETHRQQALEFDLGTYDFFPLS